MLILALPRRASFPALLEVTALWHTGPCTAPSAAWPRARTNKPQGSSSAEQETRELPGLVAASDPSRARLKFRFAISPSHLRRSPSPTPRSRGRRTHGHGEQAWTAARMDVTKVGDFCSKPAPASFPCCFQTAWTAERGMQAAGKLLSEGRGCWRGAAPWAGHCRRCWGPLPVPAVVPGVPVAGWLCQQSGTRSPPHALPPQLTPQPQLR